MQRGIRGRTENPRRRRETVVNPVHARDMSLGTRVAAGTIGEGDSSIEFGGTRRLILASETRESRGGVCNERETGGEGEREREERRARTGRASS